MRAQCCSTSSLRLLFQSLSISSTSSSQCSTSLRPCAQKYASSLSSITASSSSSLITSSSRCGPIRANKLPLLLATPPSLFHTSAVRSFSTTTQRLGWLFPKNPKTNRHRAGQVHVATGGSVKGTTVVWGDYGIRMIDHHRRISGKQLRVAEEIVRKRLKGEKYKLYKRVCASIPVHVKGNEVRMGGGRGSFDHWAARVPVSKIVFELKGDIHEATARDAFRLAGQKLPGCYEFVKKSDPPVIGITRLTPEFTQELIDSKLKLPFELQKMRNAQRAAKEASIPPTSIPAGTNSTPAKAHSARA